MTRRILRFTAVVTLAIRRLSAQPLLSIATVIGLTVAVALILTIPIYAESVAFRILSERLTEKSEDSNRPPFSYLFRYIGSWNEPVDWEDTIALDTYIREQGEASLGVNITGVIRHFESMNFRLFTSDETSYSEDNILDYMTFATSDDIFNQINIIEGTLPAPADVSPESVVDVLVAKNFAEEFGMQVGEIFLAYDWRLEANDVLQITEVRVAGIWEATDPTSPYWFYLPFALEDTLLIPEDTYRNRISPHTESEINLALWYLISDGYGINTARVDELVEREIAIEAAVDRLLTGLRLDSSPGDELRPYQSIVSVLTLTLTVFSIPIVALLIVFLMMIVGLIVDRQRNETAVLRSRGTTSVQILVLAGVEGSLMGMVALILGIGLAAMFTRLMGSTQSFLAFGYDANFVVSFPPMLPIAAGIAILFTIIIRIVPTISASRYTIVSYKLSTSRNALRPMLQRLGIDLLLIIGLAYFYYQTVQQGGLITLEGGVGNIDDAYNQPIVFLLPPLTIFGITLLGLRILPWLLRFISWLINITDNVGFLIVTRQLERSPRDYFLPLVLLVATTGLGIYTASFALTIDRYLYEQQFYRVGADVAIKLIPTSGLQSGTDDGVSGAYVNISELRDIDGIDEATRLGEYQARAKLTTGAVDSTFIGIDRSEFRQLAFWRQDFASARLGYLMNNLAISRDTVLVSSSFMQERGLSEGDFVDLDVLSGGETFSLTLRIVGMFDYFPRWYPDDDGPLFVGNLEYLFEQARIELKHLTLARINNRFDEDDVRMSLLPLGISNIVTEEPFTQIARQQTRPERQGLFGLLSIGFVASSLATMIGFLLYAIFSYQKRYVALGILRAVGLSQSAMIRSIAWELGLLIIFGVGFGFIAGLATSYMYIPYMQFISNLSGIVPPYLVIIAWQQILQIVGLFAVTFFAIMLILILILRQMKIFEAVKLGESL